jgi:hypothetical protein
LLKDMPKAAPLVQQANQLIGEINSLEERLHNPKAEVSYDVLAQRGGAKLYSKYIPLFGWVHDSDGPLTQGMRETYDEFARELRTLEGEFNSILSAKLTQFNEAAKNLDIPNIIRPTPAAIPRGQPEKARSPGRRSD